MKKVLLISMKAGWGHIKAAQAIEEFTQNNLPDIEVDHVNFREIEPSLGYFFEKFYNISDDYLPIAWGAVYETFDKKSVSRAFRRLNGFQILFKHRIERYLKAQKPDGIIFTNVVPAPMVVPPCRKFFPDIPIGVVVTDYHGHSYYNVPSIDHYFVAIPEVKDDLVRVGVDKDKISVTGIPVSQEFYNNYSQTFFKRKIGFKDNHKMILFSSRLSKKFIIPSLEGLLIMNEPINLVMICGGNNNLYAKIKAKIPQRENFQLINWATRIDEYMKAADVIVSKPGGLMISECMALGKKIIMTNPIPGQEDRNAKFMSKHGYGKIASNTDQIISAVKEQLHLPKTDIFLERINASAKIMSIFDEKL